MQKKKVILHLLYSGLGGHGSVFFSLVKSDKQGEFDTKAIFCGIEEVREDYILQCTQLDVWYRAILKRPGADAGVYLKLYRAIREAKPDVIFLHGASFIIPAIAYKRLHPRVKLIVRDTQAHHLKSKNDWFWLRLAIRFADRLVFLTKESLEGIQQRTNAKLLAKKSEIISNGLDTSLYRPVGLRDISTNIIIGMQSRLQPIKDHPTLFRAFALLKKAMPEKKLVLRIAGDGETMPALVRLVKELDIDREVEFCGMLSQVQLVDFMQSLDIYVHATLGESMSNSIMQSLACGLPTVASDVWGVNNMVTDKVNGLLYEPGNDEKLYQAVRLIIEDTLLRQKLSLQAREYAEKEYSLETFFQRYRALY